VSDLLERVRAVNPVPTCEQPSLADVWTKLEHREAGVADPDRQGGPDDDAVAQVATGRRRFGPRRVRRPGPSAAGLMAGAAIAAVVAAIALVGVGHHAGTRPAASSQHVAVSPAARRLADGTISCYFASARGAGGPAVGPVGTDRRSAITFCRDRYLASGHAGANASRVTFIVCRTSATNVAVYIADGHLNQCRRLGDRALPAGYAAAVRQSGSDGGTAASPSHTTSSPV
jgi:hypothetical protein